MLNPVSPYSIAQNQRESLKANAAKQNPLPISRPQVDSIRFGQLKPATDADTNTSEKPKEKGLWAGVKRFFKGIWDGFINILTWPFRQMAKWFKGEVKEKQEKIEREVEQVVREALPPPQPVSEPASEAPDLGNPGAIEKKLHALYKTDPKF